MMFLFSMQFKFSNIHCCPPNASQTLLKTENFFFKVLTSQEWPETLTPVWLKYSRRTWFCCMRKLYFGIFFRVKSTKKWFTLGFEPATCRFGRLYTTKIWQKNWCRKLKVQTFSKIGTFFKYIFQYKMWKYTLYRGSKTYDLLLRAPFLLPSVPYEHNFI